MLLRPSGFNFSIKQPMSCAVKNAIYCITCQRCGEQYIGETKNLRARVRVHKEHIRHPTYRTLRASEHISSCARYKDPMFTIMPFYKCRTEDRICREIKQDYFINKYKPKLNILQSGHLRHTIHHASEIKEYHTNIYYVI